jgi:hypothetical protein
MRQEPRKLPFQLSVVLTVSMTVVYLLTPYLPIIEDISPTFAFSSKYLCLWANKQWKNIHDDGNY